ncbi:hypothetical protein DSECCO2_418130 [anaerobic digester metagenome]
MVGHPVEDYRHAALVGLIGQAPQVVQRPEFGIYFAVVFYTVGRIHRIHRADGMYGHQPDHIHAQRPDMIQFLGHPR